MVYTVIQCALFVVCTAVVADVLDLLSLVTYVILVHRTGPHFHIK